jgi:predicted transcriptional regulator
MDEKDKYKLHFNNWVDIITNCDNKYSLQLYREINVTFSHIAKVMKTLEKKKLVILTQEGRKKMIKLTEKGKELELCLLKAKQLIK